jgi:hypothetical protein
MARIRCWTLAPQRKVIRPASFYIAVGRHEKSERRHGRLVVGGRCSRLANQNHIAAGRCEATSFGYAESQFASGLRPFMLSRMAPKASLQDFV